jgi:hypothetical protein
MKTILLKRVAELQLGTLGVLLNDEGKPWMLTCERPWENNQHDVSCIPVGVYTCQRITSPKHGIVFQVTNVPNRDAILIHPGNTELDSEGCILLGRQFGVVQNLPAVLNSQDAFKEFMSYFNGENSFTLKITEV